MTYSEDPDCIAALAPRIESMRAEGCDELELDAYAASFAAAFAQSRIDERARCKQIAGGRRDMVRHLAFATDLTAADAIGVLKTTPRQH